MVAFVDFEASTLGNGSYPIEVGWAIPWSGKGATLIRPEPHWTVWNPVFERYFHGISRDQIVSEGVAASAALAMLVEAVRGHEVYAADPSFDNYWLWQLARAADQEPPFAMRNAWALFAVIASERGESLDAIRVAANETAPHTHRAADDAQQLAQIWMFLHDGVGHR